MRLSKTSVNKPVTTLMIFLGVIMVGLFCIRQMPIDLYPEMDIPAVTVITAYEGAGPEEIEEKVTQVLEERLATVEDLKHIYSSSREGLSTIRMMFDWGTNLESRANDVRDAIDLAQRDIPDEADRSWIFKLDVNQFPIMVFGVRARESYEQLEEMLEDEVADGLETIPGVGSVRIIVPLQRQVNIDLDRERMASYHLTPQDVARAVIGENQEVSAGSIKMGETDYLPRVPAQYRTVEPMNEIVVRTREGTIVRLKDLGKATDGFKDISLDVKINGEPGGIILVQKQSDANTVEVARRVRATLPRLMERLPEDVSLINVMDSSEDIERMVRDLFQTLVIGGALAMLVVLVFLRQWRGTVVIGLAIPFSLIAAGIVMYFLDYSINMITLFALIVAIGMVVDNAVVVLENIARHREDGEGPFQGAVFGAGEVGMAVVASTLTTLCIFFPLFFIQGIARILFTPFAVVAAAIMLASLFTALTMTPMLSSRLLARAYGSGPAPGRFFRTTEKWFDGLADAYSNLLGWCLGHRKLVLIGVTLFSLLSLLWIPRIGSEFMPKQDRAMISGTLELPIGTRVERTAEVAEEFIRIIAEEIPPGDAVSSFVRAGVTDRGFGGDEGSHIAAFGFKLVPQDDRGYHVTEVADRIRKRIGKIASVRDIETFRIDLQDPMSSMMTGGEMPLSVNILSKDLDAADGFADRVRAVMAEIPGTVDIAKSLKKGAPEVWVDVDRQKAAALGINVSDVAGTVRAAIYGYPAGKFRPAGDEYDIMVRFREEDRDDLDALRHVPVRLPSGELIRTGDVAEISRKFGPLEIQRKDQQRVVRVEGDVSGRSLGEVTSEVERTIAGIGIPEGVTVDLGGQTEDMREAFLWLTVSLVIGIILVYMVMASQFESLLDPFVVMFSVPVAFVGVLWSLGLGGHTLNIVVFLGMLLLIGIVVNNAIVLVDYINILRARGKKMEEAVREAGRTRLRPVLMTAITTIVALLPMAFRGGQGAETWNPLGLTILGGLLVSTLVTLVLVPTIYSVFESHIRRRRD